MPLQLPNTDFIAQGVRVPDIIGEQLKAAQLQNLVSEMSARKSLLPLQMQEQQANVTKANLANQNTQFEMESRQALIKAMSDPDFAKTFTGTPQADSTGLGFDPNAVGQALYARGVKDPNTINEFVNGLITRSKGIADIYKTESEASAKRVETHEKGLKILSNKIGSILDMPVEKAAVALDALKQDLVNNPQAYEGVPHEDLAHLYSSDLQHLPAWASLIGLDRDLADYHKSKFEAISPADRARSEAQARLDVESSPQGLRLAASKAALEAGARQSAAQGNSVDAGQLLASGQLTLSDLKSRGTTPKYITQAVAAAQKINPNYNPADEVIAEHVAKSPALNTFFGSANSLIGKGGTLDQLEALGRKIPQHDLPILNTLDDWQKLARGKGPLAGYAATALGVADDYGKVMGGGNASDHARDAALRLFGQAQSPEQRADAVAATRDAVKSQRDSRIGNNQFLKRQYGVETGGAGSGLSVTAPNGKTYTFKDQASADAFRQKAGISK